MNEKKLITRLLQRVVVEALPAAAVGHGNLLKNDK
jgi:hypothetical protein